MRVEVFTFCWNEMSILPFAVDYWRKYASHVTVFDNGSNDGSVQYLMAQGDWITVEHFETGDKINDTLLRDIKNQVWKQARGRADLVVVCDLDEMLCAPDIVQSLAMMRRVGGTICRPLWYSLVSDEVPVFNGQSLHKIRPLAVGLDGIPKPLVFDPNEINEINFEFGAHNCRPEGRVRWYNGDIYLLHANHNLSLDHKISRYKEMKDRLSDLNKELGHGIHYSFNESIIRRGWEQDHLQAVNFGAILEG